jgi:hypothetical protein
VQKAKQLCRLWVQPTYLLVLTSDSFQETFTLTIYPHENGEAVCSRVFSWVRVFPLSKTGRKDMTFDGQYLCVASRKTLDVLNIFYDQTSRRLANGLSGEVERTWFQGLTEPCYETAPNELCVVGLTTK